MSDCPHCPDGHAAPLSRPWGVYVSPDRDSDGQPTHLIVAPSNGAHVAEPDADWLWNLIRGAADNGEPEDEHRRILIDNDTLHVPPRPLMPHERDYLRSLVADNGEPGQVGILYPEDAPADNGEPELDDQVSITGQYPPTGDTVWPPADNGEPE